MWASDENCDGSQMTSATSTGEMIMMLMILDIMLITVVDDSQRDLFRQFHTLTH